MTQQFLHCADIVSILQEVGCEAVPQRVGVRGFRDVGLCNRLLHGLLNYGFVHVVASRNPGARFNKTPRRREEVLPAPFPIRIWILPCQRTRQLNASRASVEVLFVQLANASEMLFQRRLYCQREHRYPVSLSLSVTNDDFILPEGSYSRGLEVSRSDRAGRRHRRFRPGRGHDVRPLLRRRDQNAMTTDLTEGFRKGASRLGVSVCTGQDVVGIDVEAGRVSGVRTLDQYVSAPVVVNAAGPYAAMIGRMVDVDVPVEPIRHFVFVTRPFEGAPSRHTLVIEFSSGWCFHREGDGILMAMGNRSAPPTFDVGVDWDFFETVMETAIRRYPAVADSAILKSWAGAYETTPDHNPILGRVGGVDGFILANGFSGHGFLHSPATGQLIAEVILDGEATSIDISPLSIDRFAKGELITEHHVI